MVPLVEVKGKNTAAQYMETLRNISYLKFVVQLAPLL
jgi:hypothetical protein